MNGAHDMGGMHGFGTINPEAETEEPVFHADWEKRVFGMMMATGFLGKWSIDVMRHALERQHPADYLKHSYYENWLVGLEKLLVESGLVAAEELETGMAQGPTDEETQKRVLTAESARKVLTKAGRLEMKIHAGPRFKPGDKVRALNRHPSCHTRQPRYVRGCFGVIHEHYGAHAFPDRSAAGSTEGRHLYNVCFDAAELWGETASDESAVYVDLWEDYLEPA
jgi:nitrile hydratase